MWRLSLIVILAFMGGINVCLDFLRHETIGSINTNVLLAILAAGVATASPALIALLVSLKTKFRIKGVNIYRASSDIILGLSLIAWVFLLFIRERPDYYPGASHMYVATWPVALGVVVIGLYLACLLTQVLYWALKHNKVL